MKDYIFIMSLDDLNKAMFFEDVEEHLKNGWKFQTQEDETMFDGLKKFYEIVGGNKND